MSDKPKFAYVGRKSCGCVFGLCADLSDKRTAESVAEFIEGGLYVERVPFGSPEYHAAIAAFGECKHEPKQLAFEVVSTGKK